MLDNIQFGPVIDVTKGRKKKTFFTEFFRLPSASTITKYRIAPLVRIVLSHQKVVLTNPTAF